jgi:integrase
MGAKMGWERMPRRARELGPLAVRNLTKPGLHFVGEVPGLALQVLPEKGDEAGSGRQAKAWILRATIGGRRRDMGLGGYPEVSLREARVAARAAREKIRNGVDPIAERRAARSALLAQAMATLTFKEASEAYITAHEAGWKNEKHRQQWRNSLAAYAYPTIGELSVRDVQLAHVLAILEPIWSEKTETATRLRGRIELVLDWATARGHREGLNPARWRGHLDKLLARPSKVSRPEHHQALPLDDLGAFVTRLREEKGSGAKALEFAILTAARSGEVRGMTWVEVDFRNRVWTIPGSRMKAGREHRVPLSAPAIELLEALPRVGDRDLVFPAPRGGQLSDMTLLAVLRRMKAAAVPHGFRSSFSDWASERTGYPYEVAEMALAHAIKNKTEAAYRRGDVLEKRRRLMEDWARFLATKTANGQFTALRGSGLG